MNSRVIRTAFERRSGWVALLVAVMCAAPAAAQPIVYVDVTATGANDGTSWANAFNDLQSAFIAAVGGGQIWVAAGTYTPDIGPGIAPGDIEAAFELRSGVGVYGHFLGTETTLAQRDLTDMTDPLRQTILSGDLGSIGFIWDDTNNVVRAAGVPGTTRLDGFTVQNGFARTNIGGVTMIYGGGLYIDSGTPTIANCTFTANQAVNGGGAVNISGAPTLVDCHFTANTADFGGGMSNFYGNPVLIGCTFTANEGDEKGGGMAEYYGHSTLTNCSFFGNFTTAFNGLGGGMYVQYWSGSFGFATLNNCLFQGNSSAHGGGMDSWGVSTLTNCTFVQNYADFDGGGFGIYVVPGTTLANCVLWHNTVGDGTGPLERQQLATYMLSVDHSYIEGCSTYAVDPNDHNIGDAPGADPGLVDPNNGNLRLGPGSPCIDAGNNASVAAGVTTDLDGNPRFVDDPNTPDTGSGVAPIVDMGAYEAHVGLPCPGDVDGDGDADLADLAIVLANFGASGATREMGDLNGDGAVNLSDLAEVLAVFGSTCP